MTASPLTAPMSRPSVLIIDDDEVSRYIVRRALIDHARVAEAQDGTSGIAMATAAPPDLIVLDLLLPDLHGSDVLHRLRSLPALQPSKIVIRTSYALTVPEQQSLLDTGALEVIDKNSTRRIEDLFRELWST